MATSKDYKEFILDQMESIHTITCRPMMGEYLLYYNGILFGGIYDNKVLIKIVSGNQKYHLKEQIPYQGAKPMYDLEDLDDVEHIKEIIIETCKELPFKK